MEEVVAVGEVGVSEVACAKELDVTILTADVNVASSREETNVLGVPVGLYVREVE